MPPSPLIPFPGVFLLFLLGQKGKRFSEKLLRYLENCVKKGWHQKRGGEGSHWVGIHWMPRTLLVLLQSQTHSSPELRVGFFCAHFIDENVWASLRVNSC